MFILFGAMKNAKNFTTFEYNRSSIYIFVILISIHVFCPQNIKESTFPSLYFVSMFTVFCFNDSYYQQFQYMTKLTKRQDLGHKATYYILFNVLADNTSAPYLYFNGFCEDLTSEGLHLPRKCGRKHDRLSIRPDVVINSHHLQINKSQQFKSS